MVSLTLARALRSAGLPWEAREGDRFVLVDRGMDHEVFTISKMVVEVRTAPTGRVIAFNGTTEWALDAVEQADALWLPREDQLRAALGEALLALAQLEDGWRVTLRVDGDLVEVEAPSVADAYAQALLRLLDP